jgi:hypothetical protein
MYTQYAFLSHTLTSCSKVHTNTYMLRKDDFFPMAMSKIYEKAYKTPAPAKGKYLVLSIRFSHLLTAYAGVTMKIARCDYLKTAIPGPTGPFAVLSRRAEEGSSEIINSASEQLQTDVDDILMRVQNAFERMKKKKENDTVQGKRFRTELHQLVAEARRVMDGVTQECLEACKQYN